MISSATAVINPDASGILHRPLRERGFSVIEMPPSVRLDARTAGHPDLQMFILKETVFIHPDADTDLEKRLSRCAHVIRCGKRISSVYPHDCGYNIALTGKYALYKKGNIPDEIELALRQLKITPVYIPQGYARCCIIPVSDECIITEDAGIAAAAENAGLDVLLVRPGFIPLKGFPRGFIGGACGTYRDTVYFTGSIKDHPDAGMIHMKISAAGKKVVELSGGKAEDYGSVFFI